MLAQCIPIMKYPVQETTYEVKYAANLLIVSGLRCHDILLLAEIQLI